MPTPSNCEYKSVLQNYKHFLELKYNHFFIIIISMYQIF